jgi:hypothetical protein
MAFGKVLFGSKIRFQKILSFLFLLQFGENYTLKSVIKKEKKMSQGEGGGGRQGPKMSRMTPYV